MPVRDRSRRTEGILSLGILVVLCLALTLVFLAKRPAQIPPDALMINAASTEQFAQRLDVDSEIAARLVAYRTQVGGFESSDQILAAPLFPPDEADRIAETLAKTHLDPQTANAKQLAAALGISPALASRFVVYREGLNPKPESLRQGAPVTALSTVFKHAPLLDPPATRPLLKRILVRRPEQVNQYFWLGALLLALAVFLVPPWLRARVGGDPFLVPLALLLFGLGVVMLFSIKDPLRDRAVYLHHLLGLIPALLAMIVPARLAPAARLRIRNYQYVWVFAVVALVGALYVFGSGPEGVKLNLFHFQPVELMKILLVFFLASYLADRADLIADASRKWRPGRSEAPARARRRGLPDLSLPRARDIGPLVVMFAFALTLFYVIKDLGPGLLLFGMFAALLYLTTGRAGFLGIGLMLLLAGGLLGYWRHVGVFATRVDMWLHPFANAHPNGMQLAQSYWAIASGGTEGSGLGLGMPGLIPRAGSDLAFVSWVEETGLLGAWLVLTVYAVLVWRGLRIALRAANAFDRALAFGLTALLGLQTLLIVAGVTGAVPLTGIALPFLSYGNSALVADFAIIGLLRGISAPPPGGVGRPAPRPEVIRATRRFGMVFALLLLGGIGLLKLGRMEVLNADAIAARPVVTPDADKVARPHQNPRLLVLERLIERGSIYDREGRVLATSREAEIAKIVPNTDARERLVDSGARLYPFGPALAHLVGYLNPGVGGPFGFEKGYDADLRGWRQESELLADYRNRNLPFSRLRRGRDLRLTIDAALQRTVQDILWKGIANLRDTRSGKPKDRAAFVLMNPQTGDVLVAATIPSFDPNTLTPDRVRQYLTGPEAEQEHVFINRAVYGLYPPGSTLKVATAACALDTLPDAADFRVECNRVFPEIRWHAGGQTYVRRNVRDDTGDPNFGLLSLAPAFRVSSNIYFANLAAAIGAKPFRATLSEKMGFRHTPSPSAFDADLPDIGYGQGRMLASPLEMARLAAAVANDGKMMQARFVAELTAPDDPNKKVSYAPAVLNQSMTAQTAATLRGLMRTVVTGGTARGVFDDVAVPVAGKTGTAQNHQFDREPHSWFIGFAPYNGDTGSVPPPAYAFACLVENGGYGRRVAAVLCRDVLHHLF